MNYSELNVPEQIHKAVERMGFTELTEVQEKAKLGEAIAIDCSRLVRMDFAAAGSVLNWAAQMQELGHVLQFSQLHQLLAVFFNVVGIQEHAQVIPRRD